MTIITTTTEYKAFKLWDDATQQTILDSKRDWETNDGFWHECTIEEIKEALEKIGFYDVKIGFSGFCSQGDGAHFTGKYSYQKGALKAIKKEFPEWHDLHKLAQGLQELQKQDFYGVSFEIVHSGHYSHENCTSFDFSAYTEKRGEYWLDDEKEAEYTKLCRDFMCCIYSDLEKEYNYLNSDGYLIESFENNEYEFDKDGNIL